MEQVGHFIGGKAIATRTSRSAPVVDPASGETVARVALADADDVAEAVQSAREAFRNWSLTSLPRRVDVLFELRRLVDERRAQIARIVSREHGKTMADAASEVARGLENIEFACGIPHLLKGGYSQRVATDVDVCELRQPLGVVVGITPFNFPFMVPLWMAATAVACGNAFILKPSEKDPSAALLLASLWADAGLPDGVFSVVNGDVEAAKHLIVHADVAAVSFVGSTPAARGVYQLAAAHGKRVQALGGAKNHMVVLPDADLDAAADAAVSAAFGSAGERCMAVSVVVAVDKIADPLVDAIVARAGRLRIGPGCDADTDIGPLVSAGHRDRIAGIVERAAAEGATVLTSAVRMPSAGGFYMPPTVLDHVAVHSEAYREEIFGPVLCVVRVRTLDQALALIEANAYGNGAALFTASGAAARMFTDRVSAGMVGINVPIPAPAACYSFGGWKTSLFGDHHVYGPDSVRFYTRAKVVTSRWRAATGIDLAFPRTR